jgi:hypothetical protein
MDMMVDSSTASMGSHRWNAALDVSSTGFALVQDALGSRAERFGVVLERRGKEQTEHMRRRRKVSHMAGAYPA